jgi:hypothetical protein
VLRTGRALPPLLDALPQFDRLVLLGDVIELRQGPLHDAMTAAAPVLQRIGGALGPEREVVIVPGNHDHRLAAPWLERRAGQHIAAALGLESAIEWRPDDPIAALAAQLEPAAVRGAYPGVWLREDVYAIHGHYADRHTTVPMFERLGAGVMALITHEPRSGPRCAEDYEATLAPIYAWVHEVAQTGGPRLGESSHGASARAWRVLARTDAGRSLKQRLLAGTFPAIVAGLNLARLGPLHADISVAELRRAALRACDEMLSRLGVTASHVIFGHTHRAGPLERDDPAEWRALTGSAMLNTGSWVYERGFLGRSPRQSPYRPGFAAVVEDHGPPRLINLLEQASIDAASLMPAPG